MQEGFFFFFLKLSPVQVVFSSSSSLAQSSANRFISFSSSFSSVQCKQVYFSAEANPVQDGASINQNMQVHPTKVHPVPKSYPVL